MYYNLLVCFSMFKNPFVIIYTTDLDKVGNVVKGVKVT